MRVRSLCVSVQIVSICVWNCEGFLKRSERETHQERAAAISHHSLSNLAMLYYYEERESVRA